jgi:hypothetical protein
LKDAKKISKSGMNLYFFTASERTEEAQRNTEKRKSFLRLKIKVLMKNWGYKLWAKVALPPVGGTVISPGCSASGTRGMRIEKI